MIKITLEAISAIVSIAELAAVISCTFEIIDFAFPDGIDYAYLKFTYIMDIPRNFALQ